MIVVELVEVVIVVGLVEIIIVVGLVEVVGETMIESCATTATS